jgi:CheY-like chemotaxis protein
VSSVLVADDDDDIRQLILEYLAAEGDTVLEAKDGTQALAVALAEQPDIAILDQRMPGLSGTEVVRRMRATGVHVEIIFMTASSDVAKLAQEVGVRCYLGKPFGLADLEAALCRARAG